MWTMEKQIRIMALCLISVTTPSCLAMAPLLYTGVGQAILAGSAVQAVGMATRESAVKNTDTQTPTGVLSEASEAGVHVVLNNIGPSSWARKSMWQEARFTLENMTSDDVMVMDVRANHNGVMIQQVGPESFTNENFASGLDALFTPGQQFSYKEVADEMNKRQVRQVTIAPGGRIVGSAFFPDGKQISEIVFTLHTHNSGKLEKLRVSTNGSNGYGAAQVSSDTPKTKKSSETTYRRTPHGYEPVK